MKTITNRQENEHCFDKKTIVEWNLTGVGNVLLSKAYHWNITWLYKVKKRYLPVLANY